MTRNRKSAKAAGSRMERQVADWLRDHVSEFIDRRTKTGAKDRGDLTGVRAHGKRVAVEIKNTTRINLAGWIHEAHTEAGNDDAAVGVVVFKRHGVGDPARQWCLMTLEDLAFFLTGDEQEGRYEP